MTYLDLILIASVTDFLACDCIDPRSTKYASLAKSCTFYTELQTDFASVAHPSGIYWASVSLSESLVIVTQSQPYLL